MGAGPKSGPREEPVGWGQSQGVRARGGGACCILLTGLKHKHQSSRTRPPQCSVLGLKMAEDNPKQKLQEGLQTAKQRKMIAQNRGCASRDQPNKAPTKLPKIA